MALTDDEKHLVYEILGIPDATSVLYVTGDYGVGSKFQNVAVLTAKSEIDTRLGALSTALETRMRELIVAWQKVSIQTTQLKPNAANKGVQTRPGATRRMIRKRVQQIVPVFLPDDTASGNVIPVV